MAQKKSRTLDEAIDELLKDYKGALRKAVKYATYKAKQDIYNKAYSCLEEYYDSRIPDSYERTDSLIHAFVPVSEIYEKGYNIISRVGIEYDPFKLEARSSYEGSSHYTPPDPWWIISNYLDGIHPTTDGSTDENNYKYFEILTLPSPTEKMEKYINEYHTTFSKNLLVSFAKQLR